MVLRGGVIKKIVKTMMLVTVFSTIERLLGFVYRVFLSRNLGSEGLGIYQVALSVIGLIMTITSSGIPITVSRIMTKHIAEDRRDLNFKTVTAGILMAVAVSLPIALALYFLPNVFGFIFTDERSYALLKIILPGVIITSVYAVLRGFFWGNKQFFTYSVIELLEEIIMLVFGIVIISQSTTYFDKIIGAGNAVLISYVFSFLLATAFYFVKGGKIKNPRGEIKPLISSSTPITLMRTATSLLNTLIAIILPMRLVTHGMTQSASISAFGELSGMAIPLIYIPSTLIGSIALVLVPELSNNYYRHSNITLKNNIEKAVKCSVYISALIIPAFLSLGKEIGVLVYGNLNAGIYIQRASIIMFPMSITLITTSMLNSLNLERKTLLYYGVGAIFLIFAIYFLPKYLGVYSLVIGLLISYVITATFNLLLIKKTCKYSPKYTLFIILSLIFIIPSALLGYLLKNVLIYFLPLTVAVFITLVVFTLFTYLLFKIFNLFNVKDMLI